MEFDSLIYGFGVVLLAYAMWEEYQLRKWKGWKK